jgi:hypothetical protein
MAKEKKDETDKRRVCYGTGLSGWETVRVARAENVHLVSVLNRHRLLFLWLAEPTSKKAKGPIFPPELHVEDEPHGPDRLETVSEHILTDLNAVYDIQRELERINRDADEMISEHAATDAWARGPRAKIRSYNQDIFRCSVGKVNDARDVFCGYVGDAIRAIVKNALKESRFDMVCGKEGKDVTVPWSYLADLKEAIESCKRHVVWDFEFRRGGVWYQGRDVGLSYGKEGIALANMVRKYGDVVDCRTLLDKSLGPSGNGYVSKADNATRAIINRLNKALRDAEVPFVAKNRRQAGYQLVPTGAR